MVLTAQSSVLRARQLAGELLTFTNVKIGDGILSAGQTESSMTDLKSTLKTVPISSLERINSDQVQLEFNYSNEGFTSEKYVREYGVFAKIGNEAEVLYAYENTSNKYDTFPAYTTSDTLVRAVLSFILKVAVSGTTQVLINENIVFPTHEEIDTEISALLQANKNLIINGGGQLTWGITANIFNWSKNLEMFPGDGKLKYKGIQIKEIIIAPGTVTLANAWDCAYISIPTTYSDVANKKVTATMTVGQYSAINGTDKFIIAVRDSDSCLQMRDGWLPYGTTIAPGGKIDSYVDKSIFIANNDFVVGTGAGTYAKKTLAETKTILGVNAATSAVTGVVQLATQAEVTTGTDSAKAVTPATLAVYVLAKIAALINSSPSTLDTLNELATALGNDPNFATTITTLIGTKVAKADFTALNDILVGTGAGTYIKKTPSEVRTILNIENGANNYVHPSTHGQSIILDDLNHILERTIQVKAVTTSSTIPNTLAAIDDYIPAAGDLILLASSGGHINDGVYTVAASGVTWTRSTIHNTEALIVDRLIKVLNGTVYKNAYFTCVNRGAITIGTTAIKMQQVYGDRTGAGLSMDNKGALRVSVQGIISEMLANNLNLPGSPTTTTPATTDDSTKIPTTAYVRDRELGAGGVGTIASGYAIGTTYTNTYNRPILVFMRASNGTVNSSSLIYINGVAVSRINGYGTSFGTIFTVPAGATWNIAAGSIGVLEYYGILY